MNKPNNSFDDIQSDELTNVQGQFEEALRELNTKTCQKMKFVKEQPKSSGWCYVWFVNTNDTFLIPKIGYIDALGRFYNEQNKYVDKKSLEDQIRFGETFKHPEVENIGDFGSVISKL